MHAFYRLSRGLSSAIHGHTKGFDLWPDFLSTAEQRILLTASLQMLDAAESKQKRNLRKAYISANAQSKESQSLFDLFLHDKYYDFQEGHYDGVIQHYREMHLTSWPEKTIQGLTSTLRRVYSLCPTKETQTHLLHLASFGKILPHVDNVSASGSWILGVSLGDERTMRMEHIAGTKEPFEILLPSGSVYLQRDDLRYSFKHSIESKTFSTDPSTNKQRLSIMVRDRLPTIFDASHRPLK